MERSQEWQSAYGDLGVSKGARQMQLPLAVLDPWQGRAGEPQPFNAYSSEKLEELADSVRKVGIIESISVRPKPNGRFEILAGHNRCAAARLAGLTTVPALVQELTDEDAAILLVDSNLQHREKLLPSEKARAYKLRMDSMKRQGQRRDLTSSQVETKLNLDGPTLSQVETKLRSDELLASKFNESRANIQRYIRLTYLIGPLLEVVDSGKLKVNPAVDISYLPAFEQETLLRVMTAEKKTPGMAMARQLRQCSQKGALTEDAIREILFPQKTAAAVVKLPAARIASFFPEGAAPEAMEAEIYEALLAYRKEK